MHPKESATQHPGPLRLKTPFGRVRIWYEESPVSCTAAVAFALILGSLFWLIAVRAPRALDQPVALALQPVQDDRGLADGGDDANASAMVEQDALARDESFDDPSEPMAVPEIDDQPASQSRDRGPETGNVSAMLSQATADLAAALELLKQRRDSAPSHAPAKSPDSKARSNAAFDKAKAASKSARRGAIDQRSPQSAKFFGLGAEDTASVVYVIDCSGSMGRPPQKLELAKYELMRSILALRADQKFFVIFFNHDFYAMPGDGLRAATDDNKQEAVDWIQNVYATGGTNPFPAMHLALQLGPESIYLLSDGRFHGSYVDAIQQRNRGPNAAAIYAIGFGSSSGEAQLKRLAREHHGTYRNVNP